jgi:hypothetical protein
VCPFALPPCLSGLPGALAALLGRELPGAGRTALEAAETTEGSGMGVLGHGFRLRVGELVDRLEGGTDGIGWRFA